MRVGLYRPVHVKTLTSQKQRMLLTARQLLKAKAIDIESDLRGTLRNFGLKVGVVGEAKFEARIRELIKDDPDLAEIVEPVLIARRTLRQQLSVLHRQLLELARHDPICRRLMTAPGVGPVVALTFRATVDVPSRFKSSKTVGAAFGLTPRRYQSGETDCMPSLLGRSMSSTSDFLPSIGVFGCRSQGSRFSSGSALLGPPMMESEGCGGPIWASVLALRHGAAQGIQRTRLIHRPCGDIAPPIGGILPSPVVFYSAKLGMK